MPNTQCQVGAAASSVSAGAHSSSADLDAIASLMRAVGACVVVDESLIDAVVGVRRVPSYTGPHTTPFAW